MKYLPIYLNDHYAGSTAGSSWRSARRTTAATTPSSAPRSRALASEIDEDRDSLKRIMDRLDVSEDRIKATLFWVGEKVGRLKPNGELLQFSPLSRVVELEGLITGVSGKLSLWRTLLELAEREPGSTRASSRCSPAAPRTSSLRLHALRGAAGLIAFVGDIA